MRGGRDYGRKDERGKRLKRLYGSRERGKGRLEEL